VPKLAGEFISQGRRGSTVTRSARRLETSEEKAISSEKRRFPRTSRLRRSGEVGFAPGGAKARGVGTSPRGGAGRSRRGSEAADEVERAVYLVGVEVSPGLGGRKVLGVADRRLRASGGAHVFGRAGSGSEAWKEKALKGRKPKRGSAVGSGQPGSARTDSQGEEGFRAGEVGGKSRLRWLRSRVTGKQVIRRLRKGSS
jgi:hypothetical protein